MWDSSQVGEMWDSSRVDKMGDSSQVGVMWDSSQVGEMWDSSRVDKMGDSSQVVAFNNAVIVPQDNAVVIHRQEEGPVRVVCANREVMARTDHFPAVAMNPPLSRNQEQGK